MCDPLAFHRPCIGGISAGDPVADIVASGRAGGAQCRLTAAAHD